MYHSFLIKCVYITVSQGAVDAMLMWHTFKVCETGHFVLYDNQAWSSLKFFQVSILKLRVLGLGVSLESSNSLQLHDSMTSLFL